MDKIGDILWAKNHKDLRKLYQYRSYSKTFILKMADKKELEFVQQLINERRKILKGSERHG